MPCFLPDRPHQFRHGWPDYLWIADDAGVWECFGDEDELVVSRYEYKLPNIAIHSTEISEGER
jgi:hypothetical protein